MQRSFSTLLTTLLISTVMIPVTVHAQTLERPQTSLNLHVTNQTSAHQIGPFNLAYLAYQGYLKAQGIPSSGALIEAIQSEAITSDQIIQAAVKANRLPEKTLNDQGYRHALADQLQGLVAD